MQATQRKSSFPAVIDPKVRVLICGSLPGERSLAEQRYYAHPQNQFWRLVSAIIGTDLHALPYSARLRALLDAGVGLWDVVASADRTGSTDAAISRISANDIAALASSLPDLRAIAFNGGTALRIGLRQLGSAAQRYAILPLPSSSPLHTIGIDAKLPAWLALRDHLNG
jgi:hypoxanthine-DNA glycosylase